MKITTLTLFPILDMTLTYDLQRHITIGFPISNTVTWGM